jgi:hypothetical protein
MTTKKQKQKQKQRQRQRQKQILSLQRRTMQEQSAATADSFVLLRNDQQKPLNRKVVA